MTADHHVGDRSGRSPSDLRRSSYGMCCWSGTAPNSRIHRSATKTCGGGSTHRSCMSPISSGRMSAGSRVCVAAPTTASVSSGAIRLQSCGKSRVRVGSPELLLPYGVAEHQLPAVVDHDQAHEAHARKLPRQPLVRQVPFELRRRLSGRRCHRRPGPPDRCGFQILELDQVAALQVRIAGDQRLQRDVGVPLPQLRLRPEHVVDRLTLR